ncbi:hypothetical protein [Pseudonocardia humida]|uniref:Uncharacterized protein n=1 Tax=Pseudonocardia humida TaxID=2800819 RepID=A0ABT1AE18_9PSEU|nr:hypothetical protein [Pseudonocardia humida]MCO1661190.1 hypothetical protein [Pseudonocardia humida]
MQLELSISARVLGSFDVLLATTDKSRGSTDDSSENVSGAERLELRINSILLSSLPCLIHLSGRSLAAHHDEAAAPSYTLTFDLVGRKRYRNVLENDVRGTALTARRLEMAPDRAVQPLVDAGTLLLAPHDRTHRTARIVSSTGTTARPRRFHTSIASTRRAGDRTSKLFRRPSPVRLSIPLRTATVQALVGQLAVTGCAPMMRFGSPRAGPLHRAPDPPAPGSPTRDYAYRR